MIQKQLAEGFEALGIRSGDTLLVHSSLKSLEGASPADVIEALLALLGPEGTLMLPTLSYLYANRDNPVFDVRRTPSNVGAIPEYFRTEYPVLRSLCPTHSCAAVGLRAEYLTGSLLAVCGMRAGRCCLSAAVRVRILRCMPWRS